MANEEEWYQDEGFVEDYKVVRRKVVICEPDRPEEAPGNFELFPLLKHTKIKKSHRITSNHMTELEKDRILQTRVFQIDMCLPLNIEERKAADMDALEIAKDELKNGTIPLIIRRYLPNKKHEDWGIEELIIDE